MRILKRVGLVGSVVLFTSLLAIAGAISGTHTEHGAYASTSAAPSAAVPFGDDLPSRTRTIVGWTTVGFDAYEDVTVSCPPGTAALGGGVDVGSTFAMEIFSTGPTLNGSRLIATANGTYGASDGWFGGTYNGELAISRPMKVAAICVPLRGVTTVVTSIKVNPKAWGWATVACPAGKMAVGGGMDVEDHLLMRVTSSGPAIGGTRLFDLPDGSHGAPDGWWGTVRNNSEFTMKDMKVGVVCQPLKEITTVISSAQATIGNSVTQRAECPAGSIATGGGIDSSNVWWDYATETAPRFELPQATLMQRAPGVQPAPIGWNGSMRNDSSLEQTLKVAAICARWPMAFFTGDDAPTPDR